jgi:SpoVK/Ycf46/Vps4 family AAA+-type ATPase
VSQPLRYTIRKTLRLLLIAAILYALLIPILYMMYRSNRGLDWWDVLGGDPRVSPEFRGYLIKTHHPLAPEFNLWKATWALPFAIMGMALYLFFIMSVMILQFVAIFWFLARGQTYVIYPREYDVSFDDVRGQPEIVESTKEALTLFQGFKRFRDAGGYPPHGILFEGPPGTGKTLLGKAIAGSAKVPFVYASGTSFNNMFMGVGNLRIMRLFKKARKLARKYGGAVIFLDELDAVGGSRGSVSTASSPADTGRHRWAKGPLRIIMAPGMGGGMGGMYVNELLIQMDGMIMPKGLWRHIKRVLHLGKPKVPQYNVMVIGATNQAATLDPALLRPGRFDRKLHVGLPSGPGREDIIQYYLDKVPHEPVDIARLGRATYGFSPAQIKNLVNEALIFALVAGRDKLNFDDLWTAKVTEEIGLKEPTKTSARDRQMTAFHEAGHAVLAYILELDDQIQVASIIKRRDTLGVVYRTPLEAPRHRGRPGRAGRRGDLVRRDHHRPQLRPAPRHQPGRHHAGAPRHGREPDLLRGAAPGRLQRRPAGGHPRQPRQPQGHRRPAGPGQAAGRRAAAGQRAGRAGPVGAAAGEGRGRRRGAGGADGLQGSGPGHPGLASGPRAGRRQLAHPGPARGLPPRQRRHRRPGVPTPRAPPRRPARHRHRQPEHRRAGRRRVRVVS